LGYGSTSQLAQQIDNGAPFDLFAAADTEHVDALVKSREVVVGTRAMYALGQLVLWLPEGKKADITELRDLAGKNIRFIAISPPKLAPYGHASIEALQRANLWEILRPKVVYGNSINMNQTDGRVRKC
jgi:molybdate transport system substrate-binding protein